jgi:hypothetical protein
MTRVELPAGISLVGVIWGKKAPLWIEADEWGAKHLRSLAGDVSPAAAIVIEHSGSMSAYNARTVKLWLEQMHHFRIEVRELSVIDYQI